MSLAGINQKVKQIYKMTFHTVYKYYVKINIRENIVVYIPENGRKKGNKPRIYKQF